MSIYAKIKELNIDLSPVGINTNEAGELYYCTPEGAEVFGWAGVDGIHYCTIPNFGEMIFAISPMNFGDCVHPIAENFDTLMALLLSCKSMDALEQCYAGTREQYDAYVQDIEITEEQKAVLAQIKAKLEMEPVKDVYLYVKSVQDKFDYSEIPYTEDYYDSDMNPNAPANLDEWGVSFDGGFWNNGGNIGIEVSINHPFTWGDEKWDVTAAYICDEGLVVDYSVEINLDRLNTFLDKWNSKKDSYENLSRVEQERLENEQPMNFGFRSKLTCNGSMLETCSGSSICWVPSSCHVDEYMQDIETKRFMKHYNLDENKAWVLWRCSYRWNQKEDQLKSLEISFERDKKRYAVSLIGNLERGATADIENPITGEKHTITALEISNETYDESIFNNPSMEYPTHFKAMAFSIEPDIDGLSFVIQDATEGDSPRLKEQSPDGPVAMAVSIIGGARGLTGINKKNVKSACSSMHFDDVFEVNWMPIFFIKELENVVVRIEQLSSV